MGGITVSLSAINCLKICFSDGFSDLFFFTLGKVLIQVEFEPPAAEAKNFGSLREQAFVVKPILAYWVDQ